ncbi:MAG TPA: CAAD domain-containing protein [Nostocaceae cyanobacterium]|nr:CAAD domain-containing protein [Nostocaceae cyanobacterium]
MTHIMATEQQQPQSTNSVSQPGVLALEGGETSNLSKLPAATKTEPEWQRVSKQAFDLLDKLPEYLGSFFSQNQQAIFTLFLIVTALVTVKVVLALLDAVNGVPLLKPTFEIIGLIYSLWFTIRYLIRTDSRQELADRIGSLKRQVFG